MSSTKDGPRPRGARDALRDVSCDVIEWKDVKDIATQTLATATTPRGEYAIRWIGRTFYLYHKGRFVECSRDIRRVNEFAHVHLQYGYIPNQQE